MFTTIAWTQSVNPAALTAINAVADPHLRVSGIDIIVPDFADRLIGFWAGGATLLARATLRSPSILSRFQYQFEPIDSASAVPTTPSKFQDLWDNPWQLTAGEALEAFVIDTAGAGERVTVVAILEGGDRQSAQGPIITTRATSTQVLVANAWTNGALTFDDNLPFGRYAIVGARARSATLQAFRLVLPGYAHRPGHMGVQAANGQEYIRSRAPGFGDMGVWGIFSNLVPPTVDFLANGADAAETVFLDLVKVE